jgi:hypothetical protein
VEAEQINEFRQHFTDIYDADGKEVNPIPDDVKLTIYCEGSTFENRGFVYDKYKSEVGMNLFIAKSWILQSDLDDLVNQKGT